jgi:nicotinate-nucleotide--dimethylbenzimidazole phosphoribosyltransferase
LAADVVEPDVPEELPVPLPLIADPLLDGDELVPEPAVPDEVPASDPELPVPVEPEPVEPELLEPMPLVVPDAEEPVLEAVFKRACPVVLSLQCVAADTLELPLEVDGEVVDWAAAPRTLAPANAADRSKAFSM